MCLLVVSWFAGQSCANLLPVEMKWQTSNTLVLLLDLLYLRKKTNLNTRKPRKPSRNSLQPASLISSTSPAHSKVQKVKTESPVKTVRHLHHKDVPSLHLLAAELNHWVTSFALWQYFQLKTFQKHFIWNGQQEQEQGQLGQCPGLRAGLNILL